jgi:glycosyltransferase involved in cell wall biosynthesis
LAWIADFQHRHLPSMFSKSNYYWRDIGYWALSHCATRLMVSSQDAKRDCEAFYSKSSGRVDAIPFAVKMDLGGNVSALHAIRDLYELPNKFYFLPNQFWKHKNHLNVLRALKLIKERGEDIVVVASGNPKDGRNPDHPPQILDFVKYYGLEDRFIFLGLIPFAHILPLMRLAAGVVNPSFFEGWSTSVEEAKAVGAPVLLSDIAIHREQTAGEAVYFDPTNPESIANVLANEWPGLISGPRPHSEQTAMHTNKVRRVEFAKAFSAAAMRTLEHR